jgi:hypothetical protein
MSGYNPEYDDSFRRAAQRKADAESAFRKIYGPERNQNTNPNAYPYSAPSIERPAAAIPNAPAAAPAAPARQAIRFEDTVAPQQLSSVSDQVRQAGNMARKYGSVTEFNDKNIGAAYSNIPNNYASNNFSVMPSKAFVNSGYNDAAVSGALRAAAARGDWDTVGRYYASQGQTFGGKMYGNNQEADLYNRAFGPGIKSVKGRDRAAKLLGEREGFTNALQKEALSNAGAYARQGLMNEGYLAAQNAQNQGALERENLQQSGLDRRLGQTQTFEGQYKGREADLKDAQFDWTKKIGGITSIINMLDQINQGISTARSTTEINELNKMRSALLAGYSVPDESLPPEVRKKLEEQRAQKKANGGLVEGYARGGQVQPVLNPMGNMGMPSSMADLDPVIRQYAQYVSTASQYGLQPVAFPKFIDLLGNARTQLASLPTQGGATGFAAGGMIGEDIPYLPTPDISGNYEARLNAAMPNYAEGYAGGGVVDWLKSLLPGVGPLPAAPQPQPQPQAPVPTVQGAMQAIQGRNTMNNAALEAAMAARRGYAMGGAVPVAGRQVFGPGGPKSDSIPAVIDGSRPAALSDGEYVFPTEAVKFFGTDKLDKMVQKARGQ